ncbi:glucose 1-dehydrogenase [Sphingobium sp. H39-3-25]|uniref:SDR family NAD(P)-dependent oxidoreductase n=1 Tax=Sphingobium arseniciresistens TaxID=3030834 RepID=UPI0023B98404|nr:glucose 1-dehydrogenase [Sphingobium arseniciresistens]
MGKLDGKVALVTGAARGMGAAHARRLAAEGARVLVTDVSDEEGAAVAGELGAAGHYAHLDVREESQWQSALDTVLQAFGRLDILVNNSGVQMAASIADTSPETFKFILDINMYGTFLGLRAAAPVIRAGGGGAIVNIASIAGLVGTGGGSAYAASKHAVIGLTKVAAMEFAASGIRVNAICPGPVLTPLTDGLNAEVGFDASELIASKLPMKRCARPEEISNLVVFLASEESSYCTGGAFVADGGLIAGISLD